MIKKVLLGLGLSIISLIGFSYGATFKVYEIGLDGYTSFIDSNYSNTYLKKGRFLSNYLGTSKSVIALGNQNLVWWGKNGMLYLFDNNGVGLTQGFFNYYQSCDVITGIDVTGMSNCGSPVSFGGQSSDIVSNFLNSIVAGDYVSIYRRDERMGCGGYCNYQRFDENICFSSSEIGRSLCFIADISSYCSNGSYCSLYPLINSQNLSNTTTFANLPYSYIGDSPGILNNSFENGSGSFDSIGDTLNINGDVDTIINFFESRYGFTENICYVGSDDFVTEYGSGSLSFEYGTGGTIFSLFRSFYSGGDLKDVGTFINVWQLNFVQWFQNRNNEDAIFYLVDWAGPGNNVQVRYDNLIFPFAGKPAVLYFMTDNIYTSSPEFQLGDEIVSYCYAKLNRENIQNGSVNFDDYYNSIPGYVQGNISSYTNYSFKPSEGYSVPSSSGGESNMWNYVVSTGNSIPDDLDPTELFKGFYNRITSLVSNYNPYSNGIIPLRIVYPFIFLILFRILRH